MAEQGASERRGTESTVTFVGQSSTLLPSSSYGISYFETGTQNPVGNDSASQQSRLHETLLTRIGVASGSSTGAVTGNQGTSYVNPTLGTKDTHDTVSSATRSKESLYSSLGTASPETSNHGTSYLELNLGPPSTLGAGAAVTIYYKLRAQDQGSLPSIVYVYWVSTNPSLASYTGTYPGGGPGINLTILDTWRV